MKSFSEELESSLEDNGLLNQTSITPSRPLISLKISTSNSTKHQPDILLGDTTQLKRQMWIEESTAILLNHQTSKTKVIPLQQFERQRSKTSSDHCMLLAEIIPKINENGEYCFDLRKRAPYSPITGKEYARNTFVNIGPSDWQQQKINLKEGDILKFGRESYCVSIYTEGKGNGRVRWFDRIHHEVPSLTEKLCRICLSAEMSNSQDHLISPCSCAGSCAYIHLECLRKWIVGRVLIKDTPNLKTYNMKLFSCQICRGLLPKFVKIDQEILQILPLYFGHKDYVLLQKLGEDIDEELLYCIAMQQPEKVIRIGRHDKSDLMLEDMSISRKHAKLHIKQGTVQLEDDNSKFGTFVVLQGCMQNCKEATLMSSKWTFNLSVVE